MSDEKTTYDELLYPSYAHPHSHPDVLATIGSLFGLSPAPVDHCRVLELGCSSGGNLVPMAFKLPRSRFLGFDLSGRSIELGQQFIAELGLGNIEIRQLDLLELDEELGRFDYILCHGVFSWVEEPVRQRILEICRDHLAPHGIAYISYNVYPGWHHNQPLRELLRFYSKRAPTPTDQARVARYLFTWLKTTITDENDGRSQIMLDEIKHLEHCDDSYLYHEYLIDENRPVYFYQFVEQAAQYDLRYLGDCEQESMLVENQQEPYARFMEACSGMIEAQQFLDFFLERRFRYSLLCHAEREISLMVQPDVIRGMWVRASFDPREALVDVHATEPWVVTSKVGSKLNVKGEPIRHMLKMLADVAPAAIPFDQLAQSIVDRCPQPALQAADASGTPSADMLRDLAIQLFHLYFAGIVQLHTHQGTFCPRITQKPLVSRLTRLEGKVKQAVTSLWHDSIFLNAVAINLLQMVDGEHDRDQLVDALLKAGEEFKENPVWAPYLDQAAREKQVDEFLENLRAVGVLIG